MVSHNTRIKSALQSVRSSGAGRGPACVTECEHYFHYDCWHTYRKHECDRREGTHTRVRCPACRHPQISEAQFVAVMVPLMERALGSGQ